MSTSADRQGSAVILDGKAVAQSILNNAVAKLDTWGKPKITLATVLVGDSAPSRLYVNLKLKSAEQVGLQTRLIELPNTVSQYDLHKAIDRLIKDRNIHAILIQLPLPPGLDAVPVLQMLPVEKDVDGLSDTNLGKLVRGTARLIPCTPLGVMRMLKHYNISTCGKRAVVVGRSYLAGLPQMLLLSQKGADATVTLCHTQTADMRALCRQADILVSAAGIANLITAEHVKPGAAVIDIGVSRTATGIQGDVCFNEVSQKAGWLTPMPGGTGPVTVACLIENTLIAAEMQGVANQST